MARPDVLNRLKELGWDGPTSYTLPYLLEMTTLLEGGMTVDQLKESRRKTSVKVEKVPRGEWETIATDAVSDTITTTIADAVNAAEDRRAEVDGVLWQRIVDDASATGDLWQRFVPEVKQPKAKKEKGAWESCENPGIEVNDVTGEYEKDGVRYRLAPPIEEGGSITWERFVPTPPKAKGKLKGQEASWDPREMLRAFENEDVRIRTGGRDWTRVDVDFLDLQLKDAQARGDAAVVIDLDGSQESADVVWLEALVAVKRRLALREERGVNGDGTPADAGGA